MSFRYIADQGLSSAQLDAFARYRELLLAWNTRMNLTAITEPIEIEIKHFLDSLLLGRSPHWQASVSTNASVPLRVADVGAGAGFPGVPLYIAYPGMHLDSMESTGKKVTFLQALAEALALANVTAIHSRAEDAGRSPLYREGYDWALARGVAAMPALLEYCLPLVRVGGHLAAYKGPDWEAEVEAGKKAAQACGGRWVDTVEASLPEGMGGRSILIYEKTKPTPNKYPRQPGVPSKQPIG